jgi:exodeoxyribonuclease VII large subunit
MSEIINDKKVFSLLEVCTSIEQTIKQRYTKGFWVKAEMNKLNYYKHSGHCYPDLLEKKDGKIVAQMRANLWAKDYITINEKFKGILKEPLKEGINILFYATLSFSPTYGISLRIIDIDPIFTLGDLEREKAECIAKLKSENIFDNNKQQILATLPQRIAIISVETSKGFADFNQIIDNNPWGYKYFKMLFPALLQGDKAAISIINQLKNIEKVKAHFDVVAIIRGGGGEVGLTCYNDYELSKCIANFPIPVLTGIGHSTNMTVVEMVAFKNAITPTEIADFLLQRFHEFSVPLQKFQEEIVSKSKLLLKENKNRFLSETNALKNLSKSYLNNSKIGLDNFGKQLIMSSKHQLYSNHIQQNILETALKKSIHSFSKLKHETLNVSLQKIKILDPINILKRGFSITQFEGKIIQNISDLKKGSQIETITYQGKISSTVEFVEGKRNKEI